MHDWHLSSSQQHLMVEAPDDDPGTQLERSFGKPLKVEQGRWIYRTANGLVTLSFLDAATESIVSAVSTPRSEFP